MKLTNLYARTSESRSGRSYGRLKASTMRRYLWLWATAALALPAMSQVGVRTTSSEPAPPQPVAPAAAPAVPADTLSPLLAQVQAAARTTTADVSLLNIQKWKVGNDVKNDAKAKAEAIQRNLAVAMPTILSQVQNSPNDLAANFKLYRNLGVLYDVMSSLAESAGAFGSKSEFEPLATDLNRIDQARHSLGDRLELLASAKDAEIGRLQSQVNAAKAAAASAPPKKVIVDEDDTQKKSTKKNTKKKASSTQSSSSQSNNPQ